MTAEPARQRLGPLGVRLALAFVAVALAAVAALAGLTAWGAHRQVNELADQQRRDQATAVAATAAQAYEQAGGWDDAALGATAALAAAADADLEVNDAAGQPVPAAAGYESMVADLMGRMHGDAGGMMPAPVTEPRSGPTVSAPVTSDGDVVGTVELQFATGLSDAQQRVNDALLGVVGAGAGLAAVVALGVAVFVSGRITRPLSSLSGAIRAMEAGRRDARVHMADAPGELGELAGAFDRMADTLEREDELRRVLVADVAHELRTPVAILQASCEALLDGVREPTPEQLSSLHDETLRVGRIVADLETLAAAQAAGLHLQPRRLDLAHIVRDAASSLQDRAADAGLEVVTELDDVHVDGDPDRLHQVVVNLIANAIRYTPHGGTVTITLDASDTLARLQVADTGPGIPVDELPHVFERFWRGSTAENTSGSGIGLAVVAELVHAHHGQVEVHSETDAGTRFTVLLPRP